MDPKSTKTTKAKTTLTTATEGNSTDLFVAVQGAANPFRNGALTLSKAAWNRLRVYIQLIDGFPDADKQQSIVADLLLDLLVAVAEYQVSWNRLPSEHKQIMVSYVRTSLFLFTSSQLYYLFSLDLEGCSSGSRGMEETSPFHRQEGLLRERASKASGRTAELCQVVDRQ